jgi:peptidylprolyl isomerase
VQYRVIDQGTGAKPTANSTVQMSLRASLPNGDALGETSQTNGVKMSELGAEMAGVREALLLMPAGSRWEIFVPASKAYGDSPRSPVGPNQALVFEVKLVSVK